MSARTLREEEYRLLEVLRMAKRVLGLGNRDLERRLGASPGYLSRVFAGEIRLRVGLVVRLAQAMELEPGEIFRAAYPAARVLPGPNAAAARFREALAAERFAELQRAATDGDTQSLASLMFEFVNDLIR